MANHWAEENLKVIRTLMERAAMYRRELAPTMLIAGGMGIVASGIGHFVVNDSDQGFIWYWLGVAIVTLGAVFISVRRQALRDKEPVWSPPTRRVAHSFVLPLLVGAVLTFMLEPDPGFSLSLWLILLGIGYHSAGFFMQRGIKLFGSGLVICGVVCAVSLPLSVTAAKANLLMGATFGGCHLAYGIYLYFTEKRNNEA